MANLLHTARIFADHGQFYAHDASFLPYDPMPVITEAEARRGWTRTEHCVFYFTVGQLYDYRVDVFESKRPPMPGSSDRLLVHNLPLPTGTLVVGNSVGGQGSEFIVSLSKGAYAAWLRCYNLGREADEELADHVFLARSDLERYELFMVPGTSPSDGVVSGPSTLY